MKQQPVFWMLSGNPPATMTINSTTGAVQWANTQPIVSSSDPTGSDPVSIGITAVNSFGEVCCVALSRDDQHRCCSTRGQQLQ